MYFQFRVFFHINDTPIVRNNLVTPGGVLDHRPWLLIFPQYYNYIFTYI